MPTPPVTGPADRAGVVVVGGCGHVGLPLALAFADRGLRLVEVDKADLVDLPDIVDVVASRPEKFVVFCDDLSFEDGEAGYKALEGISLDIAAGEFLTLLGPSGSGKTTQEHYHTVIAWPTVGTDARVALEDAALSGEVRQASASEVTVAFAEAPAPCSAACSRRRLTWSRTTRSRGSGRCSARPPSGT